MIRRLVLLAALVLTPFVAMSAPAAFPATAPGVTELKTLPAGLLVRSEAPGDYFENSGNLFRPLFRYIQLKDIAMTTPVEAGIGPSSTMYFWIADTERTKAEPDLAATANTSAASAAPSNSAPAAEPQTPRQSLIDKMPGTPPTGSTSTSKSASASTDTSRAAAKTLPEGVVVLTRPERLVVSHGGRGSYTRAHFEEARAAALAWLATRPDLVADGEACAVYWNSPFMPGFLKRYEVHIPVRAAAKPTS